MFSDFDSFPIQVPSIAVQRSSVAMRSTAFGQEVHDEAPLAIDDVLGLPEFAGAISRYQLRQAIASGKIAVERHGRRVILTVAAVREWRASCREVVKVRGFGSSPRNLISPRAGSASVRFGSSGTVKAASSLAALRMSASRLKNGSPNT
ncbi:DNA-binding protein [Devosia sp. A369]